MFANLILADEMNRAPAKVQARCSRRWRSGRSPSAAHALLPKLFLVMATQNPIEQEGTYPLPEAQMDRFLMHVNVGYPQAGTEGQIVKLARAEEYAATGPGPGAAPRPHPW